MNPLKAEEQTKDDQHHGEENPKEVSHSSNGPSLPITPLRPENTLEELLLEMKEENSTNSRILKEEITGLAMNMDRQERTLLDRITLTDRNLQKARGEYAQLLAEVDKIHKKFEESEARMERQIDLAIRENNASWENRFANLETMLVRNPPQVAEAPNMPPSPAWPASSVTFTRRTPAVSLEESAGEEPPNQPGQTRPTEGGEKPMNQRTPEESEEDNYNITFNSKLL